MHGKYYPEQRGRAQQTAGINVVEDPVAASGTMTDNQDEDRDADNVAPSNDVAT